MIKYSKFLEDIYDGKELIWKKDEEYLVLLRMKIIIILDFH